MNSNIKILLDINSFVNDKKSTKQIKITELSYNYFISDEEPENYEGVIPWKDLSKIARLDYHLDMIAEANNYTDYTYYFI